MGVDPMAQDATGLQLFCDLLESGERSTKSAVQLTSGWPEATAGLGAGTNDPGSIDLVNLG
jgi:hypothetical protein